MCQTKNDFCTKRLPAITVDITNNEIQASSRLLMFCSFEPKAATAAAVVILVTFVVAALT
jgi:hypothetical protein